MNVEIVKYDYFGSGIGYLNNKIVFVKNTIIGEIVEINILKETKNIILASVKKYLKTSDKRITPICPYYETCGGCQLLHMNYEDTIDYKLNKLKEMYKNNSVSIIKNDNYSNYRNKISLKVKNKVIGFYEEKSNKIVKIDNCYITNNCINNVIKDLYLLNVINGNITIRCNYNDELLIVINTKDELNISKFIETNHKIVGVILNDETIYGTNKFLDKINNMFFQVSYNSFFQINPFITSKLFTTLNDNISENDIVLDLYSGVSTLSITASFKAKKVYAIEIIENAVKDALVNAKMNKVNNVYNILGKVEDKIREIDDNISTIIVDPPRSGLDKKTVEVINKISPNKIIYIGCDANTQNRDIKLLNDYKIKDITVFDMFSYTYHEEVLIVLEKNYIT